MIPALWLLLRRRDDDDDVPDGGSIMDLTGRDWVWIVVGALGLWVFFLAFLRWAIFK